jgi:Uma2 family endonuclease
MAVDSAIPAMALRLVGEDTDIDLAALQGLWSEEQYLRLTDQTNRLIEFSDGCVEVLPMPTRAHQRMVALLYELFVAVLRPIGGEALFAPLRVQIRGGKFREPDLLIVRDKNDPRAQNEYWFGADIVVEVVSPDRPKRDTEEKPIDYAEAQIPEYWIINPLDETITVLRLQGHAYTPHGTFRRGDTATSLLLDDLFVSVDAVFDAA